MLTNTDYANIVKFFGKNNFKINKIDVVTYKPVIDDETIIIRTKDITTVVDSKNSTQLSYVLVVGDYRGIYLQGFQVLPVKYRNKLKNWRVAYLVKLKKEYSKSYSFKNHNDAAKFDKFNIEEERSWKDLVELAKIQEKENYPIKYHD